MMNKSIEASEENLLHIYNRFPIALEHGEGMYLYDENGKEYLDFGRDLLFRRWDTEIKSWQKR